MRWKKVHIYAIISWCGFSIHGAILTENEWVSCIWDKDGKIYPSCISDDDLVEISKFKDKESIWCWDDSCVSYRALRFWDAKNNCPYDTVGKDVVWSIKE